MYGPLGWTAVSQVVTVEPTIYLDVNPGQPRPGETQLQSAITLRNANRSPIAAFTVKEVKRPRTLNASESVDPDGLALTYKWSEGAAVLPTTAQQYQTPLLAKGSHSFSLEVTTPVACSTRSRSR